MIDKKGLLELAEQLESGTDTPGFFFDHSTGSDGTFIIKGDQGALQEFAAQILRLLARPYFDGVHQHFDAAAFSEDDCQAMVVQRVEARPSTEPVEEA